MTNKPDVSYYRNLLSGACRCSAVTAVLGWNVCLTLRNTRPTFVDANQFGQPEKRVRQSAVGATIDLASRPFDTR
jgi:hypothetical protein